MGEGGNHEKESLVLFSFILGEGCNPMQYIRVTVIGISREGGNPVKKTMFPLS